MAAIAVVPVLAFGFAYAIMTSPYVRNRTSRATSPCRSATSIMSAASVSIAAIATPSVEQARFAGMPPTETCMTCHSQIWTNAADAGAGPASLAQNKPIRWNRVHTLPDYVYFDHCIHVAKGVGCSTCHGAVDDAADAAGGAADHGLVPRLPPRSRNALRPRSAVFDHELEAARKSGSAGRKLMAAYHIRHRPPDGLLDMPSLKELPVGMRLATALDQPARGAAAAGGRHRRRARRLQQAQ